MPRWALIEGATPSPLKVRITNCWPAVELEYEKKLLRTQLILY